MVLSSRQEDKSLLITELARIASEETGVVDIPLLKGAAIMKASIQNPGIYPFDISRNRVNCTISIKVSGGVIPKSHFNNTLG